MYRSILQPALLSLVAIASLSGEAHAASEPSATRIVTVGSAVTEIVYALGHGGDVVGVDTPSAHPAAAAALPKVGFGRDLPAEGVLSLRPTLVLASAAAGPPATFEKLQAAGVRVVLVPESHTLEGIDEKITVIAEALGAEDAAKALIANLSDEIDGTATWLASRANEARPRVLFLYTRAVGTANVAGDETAAAAIIAAAGADNAVGGSFTGYRPLTAEGAVAARPDVILMTTLGLEAAGGIDAVRALPGIAKTPAGENGRILAYDDLELLGFGPRAPRAAERLARALREAPAATVGSRK